MRVSVVIPMWNQLQLTCRCLASLRGLARQPEQVIIVDNGSQPDPRSELEAVWPGNTVVRLARNQGFAGGCNAGIRQALGAAADAVLVLNNDVIVDPAMLGVLVDVLERDTQVAAAGAKMLTDEMPPRIHAAYGVLTFHGSLVRVEGWLEPRTEKFNEERDVDVVTGGAVLLRARALRTVGLFDEAFFAYHEDVDWCMRARRQGWRLRYVPRARVWHRMHASTGGGYVSAITYLAARNSVLAVRKNASWSQALVFAFYTMGNLLKDAMYRWRVGELAGYRLRLRGLRDGLLGRAIPLAELGLVAAAGGGERGDES